MIVRCGLLNKNDGLTHEEFAKHWLTVHGLIAAGMKNLRAYNQNLVKGGECHHIMASDGFDIDGYSELHFDTYGEMIEGIGSLDAETGNALLDDADILLDRRLCDILVFFRKVVREVPLDLRSERLLHCVLFLRRADGVSPAEFQHEWCYVHAGLVDKVSGYVGYNQNLVIDRFVNGKLAAWEQLPVDGMAEFYFRDQDSYDCFCSSAEFDRLVSHGQGFIGAIDTCMVETHSVVDASDFPGYWM